MIKVSRTIHGFLKIEKKAHSVLDEDQMYVAKKFINRSDAWIQY